MTCRRGTWKTITFVAALRHDKMVAPGGPSFDCQVYTRLKSWREHLFDRALKVGPFIAPRAARHRELVRGLSRREDAAESRPPTNGTDPHCGEAGVGRGKRRNTRGRFFLRSSRRLRSAFRYVRYPITAGRGGNILYHHPPSHAGSRSAHAVRPWPGIGL
jgi:hypothetical protein